MDKLQDICYQPNHLWKGQKAITKLRELSKEKPAVIKKWRSRQAIWQVHLPPPKRVDRPHYEVTIPNQMHQFDLLYTPINHVIWNLVQVYPVWNRCCFQIQSCQTSRNTKQAKDVAEIIDDIYKVGPLTYPKKFQCNSGSECKGEVTKLLEKHEVHIRCVTMKYKHTHTAFVEALNKILAE